MTNETVSSWCVCVGAEPAGSFGRLAAAQEWTGRVVAEGDEPAVRFAVQALLGWLDLDVRDARLEQAVRSEVGALLGWLDG